MQNDTALAAEASSFDNFLATVEAKEISTLKKGDRSYKLIEFIDQGEPFENVGKAYAVATQMVGLLDRWQFAFLSRDASAWGFNFLRDMTEVPQFTPFHLLSYKGLRGETASIQVLEPYALPFVPTMKIGKQKVVEVGDPLWNGDNQSAIVPIRFKDGTYSIAFCEKEKVNLFSSNRDEAMKLITYSAKMPAFQNGIGSGVWRIYVYDGEEPVMIKTYYNDKAGRTDEIHR